jgi:aspartate/methionine/tyrosine aminotransferase
VRYSSLVDRIAGKGCAAWDLHRAARAAQAAGRDVLLLTVGDPDLPAPVLARDAAVHELRTGNACYAETAGQPALRQAIAALHRRRTGLRDTRPENVVVLAGAQNAFFTASLCLLGPGDEVLVPEPTYATYPATFGVAGATVVSTPPAPRTPSLRVDPGTLGRAVTPRIRAIAFANPGNPGGAVLTREELQAIADIARQHDLWVVADEVYADLVYEGEHLSIAALPGMAERTVTIGSLSKSHAMAGWRVGWTVGPVGFAEHAERLAHCMLLGLPGFVQAGAVAALEECGGFGRSLRETYRRRRDLVVGLLDGAPGLVCHAPQGGMFVLIDARTSGLVAADLAWRLLEDEGVAVLDAAAFGPSAQGFLRLSLGAAENVLAEACMRIWRFAGRHLQERARQLVA